MLGTPLFYLLIIIAVGFLWLLLDCVYKPIGRFAKRLWDDMKKSLEDGEETVQPQDNNKLLSNTEEQYEHILAQYRDERRNNSK